MASIEAEVLDTFLSRLAHVEEVPDAVTAKLGELLSTDKLPKPDQLAAMYTEASGESLL
jgi:hypothetical protein